ncbi:hypothetical protein B0H19DRAFT_144040 [Mycena capillaripes]|nr:hypothetical protein B0H19DRAFT_144040 [Mycena capillaripes]
MWPPFALRGRRPRFSTSKWKHLLNSDSIASDLLSTSLLALKESADVFPPLKSVVGGVLAVWDIAERAKHCKSDARDIALRTKAILFIIADAVPDGSFISQPMLLSIQRFTVLLNDIHGSIEAIALTRGVSHVVRFKRNERTLQTIKSQLDDAYRDFMVYLLSVRPTVTMLILI